MNLKEFTRLIEDLSNKSLAKSGITVGKRVMEYGRYHGSPSVHKRFGFTVGGNRLADVSYSAYSNPERDEFAMTRRGIWFWTDPTADYIDLYHNTVNKHIISAQKLGLIKLTKGPNKKTIMQRGDVTDVLEKIGSHIKNSWYQNVEPYMSRKIRSGFAIYTTDVIFKEFPTIDDIIEDIGGLKFSGGITGEAILNELETLGVIKRTPDRFIPFYAYEIFGVDIEKILMDNVFDPYLDVIKNIFTKLPGISYRKLLLLLPKDTNRKIIRDGLAEAKKRKLIYVIKSQNTRHATLTQEPDYIFIPAWFLHFIMDKQPNLIQTEAFVLVMISLSWFWDSIEKPLDINYDTNLKTLDEFLSRLLTDEEVPFRDIVDMGPPVTQMAYTLQTMGLLLEFESGIVRLPKEHTKVLSAIQKALQHSFESDLWLGALRKKSTPESFIEELKDISGKIDAHLTKKWKPNKLGEVIPEFK